MQKKGKAYSFAAGNSSSGTSDFAPACMASDTCFLILSALARLTTGPRFILSSVGSPSWYVLSQLSVDQHVMTKVSP